VLLPIFPNWQLTTRRFSQTWLMGRSEVKIDKIVHILGYILGLIKKSDDVARNTVEIKLH
jgi:hypothetical protein